MNVEAFIILNSFSSRELSLIDLVHELPWTASLVGNFINFIVKELLFCFLNSSFEFLPIIQTSWMLVCIQVSITVIIPPDFGMSCDVDFLGMFMPYIVDVYSKRVDNFFENININNRISLEILYEVFHFSNKSILLFTLFDENTL